MTYTLGAAYVIRDADRAMIPLDPGNRDYQAYLAWVAAGNAPTRIAAPLNPTDGTFAADPWQALGL
jgi:hypothetical protein